MKRQDQRGQPVQQQTQPKPEAADPQQQTRGKCHVLPSPPHTTHHHHDVPDLLGRRGQRWILCFCPPHLLKLAEIRIWREARQLRMPSQSPREGPLRPWCPASPQGKVRSPSDSAQPGQPCPGRRVDRVTPCLLRRRIARTLTPPVRG